MYKGRLREGGRSVAVKIQRPGVRDAIALDVFILRWLAGRLRSLRRLNSDLPRLLDEWASSLFRELDYRQEASNGVRFAELYADMEVRLLLLSKIRQCLTIKNEIIVNSNVNNNDDGDDDIIKISACF